MDYEILEVCAERNITKMDFDDMPYEIKIEMLAHWELSQEVSEYYRKKAEDEAKRR